MTTTGLLGLLRGAAEGSAPAFLSLHESAAGLGRLRYVEVGFFERVGRRAASLQPPQVAIWADSAARAAAWRASLLGELLPVSVGLPAAAELTRSAGAAVDLALDRLGPPEDETRLFPPSRQRPAMQAVPSRPAGEVLDGPALVAHVASSFYPALLGAYEGRRAMDSAAADPPVRRVLARVIADLHAELNSASDIAENWL